MVGERKAILLGNAAMHHARATSLLALANWIGEHTGATVGFLCEAANTVGAQIAGATPGSKGLNAAQMLAGGIKAAILLNTEPVFDSAAGHASEKSLSAMDMVVTLSPFKSNLECSDVLLPIAPFTETAGTYVNAEGRIQSFHAVVKPIGEARPAWKVLRVLANMLELQEFGFEASQEVLQHIFASDSIPTHVASQKLSNACSSPIDVMPVVGKPAVASIYELDGLVRRSASLQMTADACAARDQKQEAVA